LGLQLELQTIGPKKQQASDGLPLRSKIPAQGMVPAHRTGTGQDSRTDILSAASLNDSLSAYSKKDGNGEASIFTKILKNRLQKHYVLVYFSAKN
jgi:hypothetical protein